MTAKFLAGKICLVTGGAQGLWRGAMEIPIQGRMEMTFKQKYFINSHKGLTFLAILALIAWFGRWDNVTAWVYLALHGTYGILWVLKSLVFPDRQWETDKGWGCAARINRFPATLSLRSIKETASCLFPSCFSSASRNRQFIASPATWRWA